MLMNHSVLTCASPGHQNLLSEVKYRIVDVKVGTKFINKILEM